MYSTVEVEVPGWVHTTSDLIYFIFLYLITYMYVQINLNIPGTGVVPGYTHTDILLHTSVHVYVHIYVHPGTRVQK